MRNRLLVLAALGALTAGVACNDKDFLTEKPFDFIGPTNFYPSVTAARSTACTLISQQRGSAAASRDLVEHQEMDVASVNRNNMPTCTRSSRGTRAFKPCGRGVRRDQSRQLVLDRAGHRRTRRARSHRRRARFRATPLQSGAVIRRALGYTNAEQSVHNNARSHAQSTGSKDAIALLPSPNVHRQRPGPRIARRARTLLARCIPARGTGVGTAADWASSLTMSSRCSPLLAGRGLQVAVHFGAQQAR